MARHKHSFGKWGTPFVVPNEYDSGRTSARSVQERSCECGFVERHMIGVAASADQPVKVEKS